MTTTPAACVGASAYGANADAAAKDAGAATVPAAAAAAASVSRAVPIEEVHVHAAQSAVVPARRANTVGPTVDAAVVQPCAQTRTQLQARLEHVAREHAAGRYRKPRFLRHFIPLAGFDPATAASDAVACRQCTIPVSLHREGPTTTPTDRRTTVAAPPDHLPSVRLTVAAGSGLRDHVGCHCEYPAHFRGSGAWFARFLEFDGYGPVCTKEQEDGEGGTYTRYFQSTRYRCAARADHDGGGATAASPPCGEVFTTWGFELRDTTRKLRPGSAADLTPLTGDKTAIDDHFRSGAHKLRPLPTSVGWTTSLCGCCSHAESVCDCLLCYTLLPPLCAGDGDGYGMFCALQRSMPTVTPDDYASPAPVLLHGSNPRTTECDASAFGTYLLFLPMAPAAAFLYAGATLLTVLSLAGIPCECAPLMCWPCYWRRRNFVYALRADESPIATNAATLFCCPCSECQQWRELRNSGVWPGLTCFTAGAEDMTAMRPAAVRRRYAVDAGYAVYVVPATATADADADADASARVQQDWWGRQGPAVVYGLRMW